MTAEELVELVDRRRRMEIMVGLREGITAGFVETAGFDKEGRTLYKLTDKGTAVAEVESHPEA